jgi:hypothetical protein
VWQTADKKERCRRKSAPAAQRSHVSEDAAITRNTHVGREAANRAYDEDALRCMTSSSEHTQPAHTTPERKPPGRKP